MMNREEAIVMWVIPALKNTWNEKRCNEVLEALEQEPCDAVSRKEVINMLHNHAFDYATSTKISALLKTMRGEVDRMPSVTPAEKVGRWVPCEKRLPDKLQDVLITFYDAEGEYDVAYMRKTFNASYKAQGSENEWVSSMGETTYADYEVSAWMPLPEPYKAESEIEE